MNLSSLRGLWKKRNEKKNEYICTVCKCHQRTQFFNVIISHRQLKHDITYFYPNHLISNRYNIAWTRIFYFTKLSMGLLSSDNSIFKLHFPCKWFTIPEMFYFLILRRSPFGHCISTVLSTFANRSLSVFSQLVRSPHGWYVLIDRTVLVYNSGGFFFIVFRISKVKVFLENERMKCTCPERWRLFYYKQIEYLSFKTDPEKVVKIETKDLSRSETASFDK